MMKILIKNATCVFPEETVQANIVIEGTTIASVDAPSIADADEVVDGQGLHLFSGIVDDQVHFRDPGLTHKEDLHSGSLACAKGGVTTFLEMPNTNPPTVTVARLAEKLAVAATKSVVNYGFYIGATPGNLPELQQATRTPGIKIFLGSSTGTLLVDSQDSLERIFSETSLPICAHCEDEATVQANAQSLGGGREYADHSRIRDTAAAVTATTRALELAHRHNHRFHVLHVSTAQEIPLVADHRGRITAEVCPHHLLFNTGDYARLGSLVQMNPSVKTAEDNAALWQGLRDGFLQVVATDHAPHTLEEKQQPYPRSPSGVPAVENSLAIMLDAANRGQCTLQQIAHWMSDAPARVWDLVGKGRIAPGYDADLVLVDLNKTHTVSNAEQLSKCRWSPWHGQSLTGWPVQTWVLGQVVWAQGHVRAEVRGREAWFDHARGGYWATEG